MMTTVDGVRDGQARIFYNVGRHATHDLSRYFEIGDAEESAGVERAEFERACDRLSAAGYGLRDRDEAWERFSNATPELRAPAQRAGALLRDSAAAMDRRPLDHRLGAR